MNISDLCAEIMKQNYTSILGKNYSKLAILLFLKQNNFQLKKTSLMRVCQFTYRFFRDNIQYGKESNYVILKNIEQYMPEDLTLIVKTELNEWVVNVRYSRDADAVHPADRPGAERSAAVAAGG